MVTTSHLLKMLESWAEAEKLARSQRNYLNSPEPEAVVSSTVCHLVETIAEIGFKATSAEAKITISQQAASYSNATCDGREL